MLICIENKVFSNVHDNQLDRYYSYIENDLDNDFKYSPYWNRAYILLAPDGKALRNRMRRNHMNIGNRYHMLTLQS